MNGQTAVVLGATGLIGSEVVKQLLNDDGFAKVRVLVRQPLDIQHPKLETIITNFSNYEEYKSNLGTGDCIFSCIGTTNAKVKGDKLLYRTIDFDIPVNAARFGKEAGFQQFLLVSAAGVDPSSRIFYARLKAEVEEVISTFNYNSFHIFRPSLLLGDRKEKRFGESISKFFMTLFSFMIPAKYKSIHASVVAAAMIRAAKKGTKGLSVYYYKDMINTAS